MNINRDKKLLSANDGCDVQGPIPLSWAVDGRPSGCVMYDDVSDAELLFLNHEDVKKSE